MKDRFFELATTAAGSAALALAVSVSGLAQASGHSAHDHMEPKATHGMLVVGTKTVFLSHLPMFHSPHDYQAIFEAELDADTKAVYLNAKAKDPIETVYTLVPEKFVLPEMAAKPVPFKAVLYKGHFERGGLPIASTVTVRIKKVLSFEKLHAESPKPDHSTYLIFGDPNTELFIAHKIGGRPDFDQIAQIEPLSPLGEVRETLASNGMAELSSHKAPFTAPLPDGPIHLNSEADSPLELMQKTQYLEFNDLSI